MTRRTYTPTQRRAIAMKEVHIQGTIAEAVARMGGRCWHVRDSRKLAVQDQPDLLILLPPKVYLVEVKSQYREITDGQAEVLELASRCTEAWSGIVRPVPEPGSGELDLDEFLALIGADITWR